MFLNYRSSIAAALVSLASMMLMVNARTRQTPGGSATTSKAHKTNTAPAKRMTRHAARAARPARTRKPAKEQPFNFLSGDASVMLRVDKPQLISLGLTYNRVLVIEFPASDRFFRWHGGNSQMIYMDDSPTKKTDNFIVLRAVPPHKENPAGFNAPVQISIQMRSGLVVPFMIYPTNREANAAYRCVLRYDRDEVIRMRRAEGLAVNLDMADTSPAPTELTSVSAGTTPAPATSPAVTLISTAPPTSVPFKSDLSSEKLAPVVAEIERKAKKLKDKSSDPNEAVKSGLAAAIKEPKQFKRWTLPLHGLAVSTVARDVNESARLVIVAVRNTKTQAVRIMPGHPDIYVETFGDNGKPIQVERVKQLHTETTTESRVLPAGAIVYYALVFETPILGVNQHLRVAVGQTNAADEPTAADLTAAAR